MLSHIEFRSHAESKFLSVTVSSPGRQAVQHRSIGSAHAHVYRPRSAASINRTNSSASKGRRLRPCHTTLTTPMPVSGSVANRCLASAHHPVNYRKACLCDLTAILTPTAATILAESSHPGLDSPGGVIRATK